MRYIIQINLNMDNPIQAKVYLSDSEGEEEEDDEVIVNDNVKGKKSVKRKLSKMCDTSSSDDESELEIDYDSKIKSSTGVILKAINPVAELAFFNINKYDDKLKICDVKNIIATDFSNDMRMDTRIFCGYLNYFFNRINLSKRPHRRALYSLIVFDMIFRNRTIVKNNKKFLKVTADKLKELVKTNYTDNKDTVVPKKDIKEFYNTWNKEIKKEFNLDVN